MHLPGAGIIEGVRLGQLFRKKSIDKLIADAGQPRTSTPQIAGPMVADRAGHRCDHRHRHLHSHGHGGGGRSFGSPFAAEGAAARRSSSRVKSGRHRGPSRGRPAIALSFLLVAIACALAGLCYAELASMIPVAGSAYTYSYATLGEIIAWIIGWDLILEYAVSNMAVAVGFSAYVDSLLRGFGIELPRKLMEHVHRGKIHRRVVQRAGVSYRDDSDRPARRGHP